MPYASCLVNGVFWAPGTTRLITEEQGRTLHPANFDSSTLIHEGMPRLPQRLLAIADISNDLGVRSLMKLWADMKEPEKKNEDPSQVHTIP